MRLLLAPLLIAVIACGGRAPGHSVATSPYDGGTGPAVLLADGRVFVAGGALCSSTSPTPAASTGAVYDPATDTWTSTAPFLTQRGSRVAPLPDGRVMLVGGSGDNGTLATTEIFDPRTMAFSKGPDLPTPRAPRAVFTLKDGSVVAAGGGKLRPGEVVSADILAPGATAWRTVPLTGAMSVSTLLLLADESLLAVGGIVGRTPLSLAIRVDLRTAAATRVADMPQAGALTDAVLLEDGRALFSGPESNTFQIFDPASGHWRSGSQSLPVEAPIVTLPDGRIIVLGGYELDDPENPDSAYFLNRVHVFDPRRNEWQDFSPLLAQRILPTATLLRDGRVLVVGGVDGLNGTCDPRLGAEIYSP